MQYPGLQSSVQSKNAPAAQPNRTTRGRILVVDDEEDIVELVTLNLVREGYDVLAASTGEQAIELARARQPDLAILDLMLPGIDGLEVCRVLKTDPRTEQMPVIVLTAKSEDSDIIAGLELGADDYVTKPFSSNVLIARVRRVLRKKVAQHLDRGAVRIHDMTIDPARCEVLLLGKPITLTFSEFNILYTLAKRPGIVFTRYQIVDALHGSDHIVTERAVDVQIAYLRKKLGSCKDYIETIRGVGYRFRDHPMG
ncbi:MAG TPA: response regulator transcription factor [Sedimentisphaerales bacterium]|jgi:two-component system phosphate regulon response regulator PhoB|nr:response regulator transcription factor [Sedimentisphaerales bacterium]HNU31769.1 response regulator transcription factor [Sedimentisphaerales bacterium]